MNPRPTFLRKTALSFALFLVLLSGCSQQPPPEESAQLEAGETAQLEYTVSFLGRTIDLEPYFQGYPYGAWNADFEAGKLFYRHTTPEGTWMMVQDLEANGGVIDPEVGKKLMDIDLSTRNLWGMKYDHVRGDMIVTSDERNDEVFNLYRLSLQDGSLTKLTDVPYIYGWDFSKDKSKIGYIARFGDNQPYKNCLTILDLETGKSVEVICEQGSKYSMVWTSVNFTPDDSGVIIRLNRDGHRRQGTLAYINLGDPEIEILLPDGVERQVVGSNTKGWLDDDRFIYQSDETGYGNLYVFDLASKESRPLTSVAEQAAFDLLEIEGETYILQVLDRPHENVLQVLNLQGQLLGEKVLDSNIGTVGFDDKSHFIVSMTSVASPFQADAMEIRLEDGEASFEFSPRIRLPEDHLSAIQQCNVERVEIPTFDTDPATGASRMLHAFLMTSKNPRENKQAELAVITAFYGGRNDFRSGQQIFCEAGISWLSPAVRGSSGFGKDFMALNDLDLGGDEIIDLFYAARFLEKKLGLEPTQIGVAGGSHGGYATMRALTFPAYTNDRGESYDFGFGMSHAGFSNIVTFYDATNIPDWIILESGDPTTDWETMQDRSPLNHTDLLQSPILLTHGSNDNRVGVTESRQFVEAAKKLDKPVTYVEFEGQGHGISGLENQVTYYQARFNFLKDVICAARGSSVPECE